MSDETNNDQPTDGAPSMTLAFNERGEWCGPIFVTCWPSHLGDGNHMTSALIDAGFMAVMLVDLVGELRFALQPHEPGTTEMATPMSLLSTCPEAQRWRWDQAVASMNETMLLLSATSDTDWSGAPGEFDGKPLGHVGLVDQDGGQ